MAKINLRRNTLVKLGQAKPSGGTLGVGVPNAFFTSQGVSTLTINEARYMPFLVYSPMVVTALKAEVTSSPVSAANLRCGLYAADLEWQPSGAPLLDTVFAVANTFTGVKSATGLSVPLAPGHYLTVVNCDVAMQLRTLSSGSFIVNDGVGATPFAARFTVAQTYGAFPNPGTAWTTAVAASGGLAHQVFMQWSE